MGHLNHHLSTEQGDFKDANKGKLLKAKEAGKRKRSLSGDVINTADDVST